MLKMLNMKPIPTVTVHTVLNNLRLLRLEKDFSCRAIASKLCISEKSYRAIEKGTRPMSLDQFLHLADIMRVSVAEFTTLKTEVGLNKLCKVS